MSLPMRWNSLSRQMKFFVVQPNPVWILSVNPNSVSSGPHMYIYGSVPQYLGALETDYEYDEIYIDDPVHPDVLPELKKTNKLILYEEWITTPNPMKHKEWLGPPNLPPPDQFQKEDYEHTHNRGKAESRARAKTKQSKEMELSFSSLPQWSFLSLFSYLAPKLRFLVEKEEEREDEWMKIKKWISTTTAVNSTMAINTATINTITTTAAKTNTLLNKSFMVPNMIQFAMKRSTPTPVRRNVVVEEVVKEEERGAVWDDDVAMRSTVPNMECAGVPGKVEPSSMKKFLSVISGFPFPMIVNLLLRGPLGSFLAAGLSLLNLVVKC